MCFQISMAARGADPPGPHEGPHEAPPFRSFVEDQTPWSNEPAREPAGPKAAPVGVRPTNRLWLE